MLVKNIWIVILSVLFFGGIIVWQLLYMEEMKELKEEIFMGQAKIELQELATTLKERSAWGKGGFNLKDLNSEVESSFYCTVDSLILLHFGQEQIGWGVVFEDKDSVVSSNVLADEYEILLNSGVKTCLSCLIAISYVDKQGGLVIDHSVAQIRAMFGDEKDDIMFLYMYRKKDKILSWFDYLVFVFIIGLTALFSISIYLNSRQKKLIEQKNEFINHLSHQFKTPLASIRLGTNMLLKSDEFKNNKMLQVIHLESNRLEKHIQTVLQWVRSGAQGLLLDAKFQDVVHITRNAIAQMEPIFKKDEVILETDFEEEQIFTKVDDYHLTLVYFNLWENAIKHNPSPLKLKIVIRKSDKSVVIEHQDNGQGFDMKKSHEQSLFTGLGLLYVQKVMRAHGGVVEVISGEGKGTRIILQLPLAPK